MAPKKPTSFDPDAPLSGTIWLRLTDAERDEVERRAKAAGDKVSAYVRRLVREHLFGAKS